MALKTSKIALNKTGKFSKLMLDYIDGADSLKGFYNHTPQLASFKAAIDEQKNSVTNRELLVAVIKKQYAKSGITQIDKTIDVLLANNTFTVCTGHQLCLFTGPLYFIYKIITTINLAESLKKEYPDSNFVPVYWMASEDHDFEEVKSINLFSQKVEWENAGAKGAVGKMDTASIDTVVEELKQVLGDSENAKELIQLFNDAYLNCANLADATRHLVNQLFGKYGLLIIDANDSQLKSEFAEFIEDDIINNINYKHINSSIEALGEIGFKPQVSPREINCFYMMENLRERIVLEGSIYKVLNTSVEFSKEELVEELKSHPERFSPNVVTRPLYQQFLLPNLAYVGGPGEIAYWLEYKSMFEANNIVYPILIPRNFTMLMDSKEAQQIDRLGLTLEDIFKDTDLLIKKYVEEHTSSDLLLNKEEQQVEAIFKGVSEKVAGVDVTLVKSVEGELSKALKSIKTIEAKLLRSEKRKHEVAINQIKKIKDKYIPAGVLQERYNNISPYYLKKGTQLIDDLKEAFDPFESEMIILEI